MNSDELRKAQAAAMSEADLQRLIVGLAQTLEYLVQHCRRSMSQSGRHLTAIQGDKGYPDLTIVGHGRIIFAELKSEKGRLTPGQHEWLEALALAESDDGRVEVHIWRPSQWLSGEIEKVLRGG